MGWLIPRKVRCIQRKIWKGHRSHQWTKNKVKWNFQCWNYRHWPHIQRFERHLKEVQVQTTWLDQENQPWKPHRNRTCDPYRQETNWRESGTGRRGKRGIQRAQVQRVHRHCHGVQGGVVAQVGLGAPVQVGHQGPVRVQLARQHHLPSHLQEQGLLVPQEGQLQQVQGGAYQLLKPLPDLALRQHHPPWVRSVWATHERQDILQQIPVRWVQPGLDLNPANGVWHPDRQKRTQLRTQHQSESAHAQQCHPFRWTVNWVDQKQTQVQYELVWLGVGQLPNH